MRIPSQKMRLSRSDEEGIIHIPGCITGYSESKRILGSWIEKAKNTEEDNKWWFDHLKKRKQEVIYVSLEA